MPKDLYEYFMTIMSEYGKVYAEVLRTQNYKHPFSAMVRTEVTSRIKEVMSLSDERYKIKGSCGAGRWTAVPWIAIFDRRITESAQKGVYIVYLFNKDSQKMYLTLNQGATSAIQDANQEENSKTIFTSIAGTNNTQANQRLQKKACHIRELLGVSKAPFVKEMKSGSTGYDAGAIYSKEYTMSELPKEEQLITDLREFIYLYEQYYSKVFNVQKEELDKKEVWWPSHEEYPLNLTKDDWKKYILEVELPEHPSPMKMLKGMMELGGEASCKQLAETYGGHPSVYVGCTMNLGRRVKAYFNLPPCMDGEQERYFPFPFLGKHKGGSEDNYIYRLRPELYEALKEIDLSGIDPRYERGEDSLSTKEILQHINTYIVSKGFTFDEGLIENYYLSLKSKPFVILAGTSGTGKTRLVRLFAEAIGAVTDDDNTRYKLVSVRPDWSDSSDLFGHVDLSGKFKPGAIIDFVKKAESDKDDKPYFLCLDEMNLARVEYYLSDILSVIETRELKDGRVVTDSLISENVYGTDAEALKKYGTMKIPENLYIIGTVNMDETTFPFSKKVLDRANTIEFSTVDFLSGINESVNEAHPLNVGNEFMKAEYVFFSQCANEQEYVNEICVELQEINKILERANAHVGYRVRDEIVFYMLNNKKAGLLKEEDAFDNEIMQKILPRIQGSSIVVKNMLCELFKRCAGDYESFHTENDDISSRMFKAAKNEGCKYKKSAEKIAFMVRRFEEDGFTAYWI